MALYSIIQYISVTLLYWVGYTQSAHTVHIYNKPEILLDFQLYFVFSKPRFSATWETSSSSSLTSPSFSSSPSQVTPGKIIQISVWELEWSDLRYKRGFFPVFSEPEPGVGGAGVAPASVQPRLWASALLGSDSDPHLPGLPGPGLRLGAAAELV